MLKGIETQTMITRATEYVRDADAQQRKNDMSRDFMAAQTQNLVEQEQQQVTQTPRSQESQIQRERQGNGRQEQEEAEEQEEKVEAEGILIDEDSHSSAYSPRGTYIIDIKV